MIDNSVGISYQAQHCGLGILSNITDYRCFDLTHPSLAFWFIFVISIFVLIVIFFLLLKIWQSKSKSIFFKIFFTIIGFILVLGALYIEVWNFKNTSYQKVSNLSEKYAIDSQMEQVNIPSYVIETSNNLIIQQIGNERFDRDIIYNAEETKRMNIPKILGKNTDYEYKIAYHYKPLEILNNNTEDSLFYVAVTDLNSPYYEEQKDRTKITNNLLPNCVVYPSMCEFHLSARDAIKIAKENGFNANDLTAKWDSWEFQKLTIKLSSCSQNKIMYLSYQDEKIIKFKDEVVCGGAL